VSGEEAREGAAPGNPTEIRDWRDPAEWPIGAKPVTRKIAYDDLYRVNQIQYEYSANDASWISPFARENGEHISDASFDHRRNMPSPYVSFQKRVLEQDISYDWLGNTSTTDDDAHGFYDRSLGTITNNSVNGKPYQLTSATNASKGGNRTGSLNAKYDVAGNLTDMAVNRNPINDAACLPSGSGCNQTFHYQWDEVGRLVHAQRWDIATTAANLGIIIPTTTPPADLTYTYDASDNRVLKSATAKESNVDTQRHSVYISGGQELRGAKFAPDYLDSGATGADYQIDSKTEIAYLFAHGVRLGRVAYDNGTGMPAYTANAFIPAQHVLINLDDTLGSTAIVIDKATSELVEASSYLAHGATESDYRPDRWNGLREDYRFTGKEEDVEVGLQYFGKRFLSPYLNRWVSADPLGIHDPVASDHERQRVKSGLLNLYAYVSGRTFAAVDIVGLLELQLGIIDALTDKELMVATKAMGSRMQQDLRDYFGIVANSKGNWRGVELKLADAKTQQVAKDAMEAKLRATGKSPEEIAQWNVARSRLLEKVSSSDTIEISTKSGNGGALMFGETSPGLSISMNPYSWFTSKGKDISKGSSKGAIAQMGPGMSLLHETTHEKGCMSGEAKACMPGYQNSFDTHASPEQVTTQDVTAHTRMIDAIAPRLRYGTPAENYPGGTLNLGQGQTYEIPSENQLTKGESK